MKIYHLSCGSLRPLGGYFIDGHSPWFGGADLVCHCLLIETSDGLVLVNTGFGLEDVKEKRRISWPLRLLLRPYLREENTALRQIQALGYKAEDVRHIVLTHLDFDHAGGLADFPHAEVHVADEEYESAMSPLSWRERFRSRPDHWPRRELWHRYRAEGEPWYGFTCARELRDLPPELLMIPLPGHTRGHCGVAAQNEDGHWMLLAGGAYFHHRDLDPNGASPWGAQFLQRFLAHDHSARLANQARLLELKKNHSEQITIFCSHDRHEYRHLRKLAPPPLRLVESREIIADAMGEAI